MTARRTTFGLTLAAWLLVACGPGGGGGSSPANSVSVGPLPSGTPAPNFSLTDQFGHPAQLSDFRGHVVLLSFIDGRCTTICPLTAELMAEAKQALGSQVPVQLVAINANPDFTSVSDVRRWSIRHRMLRTWRFLTGPIGELRAAWRSFGIQAKVVDGDVAHTAVIFLIDAHGGLRGAIPIAKRGGIEAEAQSIAQAVRNMPDSAM
jgi:cytochrome oxidase Cu insertion factor (SCO1/SenC/PrrC family)